MFVMEEGRGRDRILDFNEDRDKIDVSGLGVTDFDDLAIMTRYGQTMVNAEGETLLVWGVRKNDLDEDNFIFADEGDMIA